MLVITNWRNTFTSRLLVVLWADNYYIQYQLSKELYILQERKLGNIFFRTFVKTKNFLKGRLPLH